MFSFVYICTTFDSMNEMSKSIFIKPIFSYGIRANFKTLLFLQIKFGNFSISHPPLLLSSSFFFSVSLMANTIVANASTTKSLSSSQDSYNLNDLLFLHRGENPGAVLTSQPLIGGENYPAWTRSVRKSLIAKNKLGFIDGSLTISSPLVNSPTAA